MKKALIVLALLLGSTLLVLPQQQAVPEIPYDSVDNFFKLPDDLHFGEGAGVAVNSKGHVFVFNRGNVSGNAFGATAAILLEFDQNGKYLREIGHNLYAWAYAHAVRVDKDDNIWAIDKGSDMVVKFNPQGRVTMVFGRKKESSDEAAAWTRVTPPRPPVDGEFRQPTDVTWDTQGNIFISDGYINSRIAKYDKNGDWVKSFGEPGTKDGQFDTPHSIAADAAGNIFVADRNNFRIQVFTNDGKHLRTMKLNVPVPPDAKPWKGPMPNDETVGSQHAGAPWAICITPGPTQYLYAADAFPGRVYKMTLDGKILGVLGKAGKLPKQFGWIHEIACPSENELYVTEVVNWRVQKLILHPKK